MIKCTKHLQSFQDRDGAREVLLGSIQRLDIFGDVLNCLFGMFRLAFDILDLSEEFLHNIKFPNISLLYLNSSMRCLQFLPSAIRFTLRLFS